MNREIHAEARISETPQHLTPFVTVVQPFQQGQPSMLKHSGLVLLTVLPARELHDLWGQGAGAGGYGGAAMTV
jgi:hypothetical protein